MVCGKCNSSKVARERNSGIVAVEMAVCATCGYVELYAQWAPAIVSIPLARPRFALSFLNERSVEITWAGVAYAIPQSVGIRHIVDSLRSPGYNIFYLGERSNAAQVLAGDDWRDPEVSSWDGSGISAQPVLDKKALAKLHAEMKELREGGYDETDPEFQAIQEHVRAGLGQFAPLAAGSARQHEEMEKARLRIRNAITRAIAKIESACKPAADHLAASISFSMDSYVYEPAEKIEWSLPQLHNIDVREPWLL